MEVDVGDGERVHGVSDHRTWQLFLAIHAHIGNREAIGSDIVPQLKNTPRS